MKSDTWLIQNIGHAYKTGTDLRCQTDSLRFPSGKSCCSPSQRKVVKSYLCQESHSCPDLLQNLPSDQFLLFCQLQFSQKLLQILYGKSCQLINILIANSNSQSFFFQTLSLTGFAWGDAHKSFIFLLHGIGTGLPVSLLHIFDQSRKRHIINAFSSLTLIINLDRPAFCSMDQHIFYFLGIILKRCIQTEIIFLCKSIQNGSCKASLIRTGLPSHYSDSSL